MKILIVSDTHGSHSTLEKALAQIGMIDMFIHMGDVDEREDCLEHTVDCESHIIAGNGDFFSKLPREKEFLIGSKKVFITHGHIYGVSVNLEELHEEGLRREADIVMFGHTHAPFLEMDAQITLLNPGSISQPRQAGHQCSFMVMHVGENEDIKYQTFYLEKNGIFVEKLVKK
ncbi:MAG: metallophosphoesterase [Lachnospiraceae bacterium]|nr:metallophosphoesterase [Lachnospiraceae bacterium]